MTRPLNTPEMSTKGTHLADGIEAALVLEPVEERGEPAKLLTYHVLRRIQGLRISVHQTH